MPSAISVTSSDAWSLKNAIDLFFEGRFGDGDIVSHDFLRLSLDLPEPKTASEFRQAQWVILDRIEQFKSELLVSHKICLTSVHGKGYMVVPPQDQARHAVATALKAVHKGLSTGEKIISNTRLDALSDNQRKRHIDAEVKLSSIGSMVKRERRDVFRLFASPSK